MGRHPKRYSQAERLTRIIRVLASRACAVNDLAQEFAVTRRQVYRDLARIEEEGHPLVQSDGAGERSWETN
jgi:predicted DNA-binding transcriptional regulator YafY